MSFILFVCRLLIQWYLFHFTTNFFILIFTLINFPCLLAFEWLMMWFFFEFFCSLLLHNYHNENWLAFLSFPESLILVLLPFFFLRLYIDLNLCKSDNNELIVLMIITYFSAALNICLFILIALPVAFLWLLRICIWEFSLLFVVSVHKLLTDYWHLNCLNDSMLKNKVN